MPWVGMPGQRGGVRLGLVLGESRVADAGGIPMGIRVLVFVTALGALPIGMAFAGCSGSSDGGGGATEVFDCSCNCYTDMGYVPHTVHQCATDEDDAYIKADKYGQSISVCYGQWVCGSCNAKGTPCG